MSGRAIAVVVVTDDSWNCVLVPQVKSLLLEYEHWTSGIWVGIARAQICEQNMALHNGLRLGRGRGCERGLGLALGFGTKSGHVKVMTLVFIAKLIYYIASSLRLTWETHSFGWSNKNATELWNLFNERSVARM